MLVFLISLIISPVLSLFQSSNTIFIYGVKPNLVMALLIAYALVEKDWLRRIAILLVSNIALVFGSTFNPQSVYWIVVMLLSIALIDYLPWNRIANTSLALLIGVVLINIENLQIPVVIMELVYTISFLYLLFLGLSWIKTKQGLNYV